MTPAFTIKDAFSYGWNKLSENFWFLVLLALAFFVLGAALESGPRDEFTIGKFVNIFVSFFAMFTFVRFGLKIGKGEKPFWNNLFEFKPEIFGFYILASLAYSAMNLIGLALIIVPGIISIIRFGFFGFIMVDEGLRPIHSLKKSWAITKGHFWKLFGLSVCLLVLNFFGALAMGLGLLITVPLSLLVTVYVYQKIKGAPLPLVAEPIAPPAVIIPPAGPAATV
ncbi:MAG: hypothetical protein Q8L64_06055 [bacterium]|nr:hypothetical protein [bacterium]